MKRFIGLMAFLFIVGISVSAQSTSTTVGTTVLGIAGTNPTFLVDGTAYQTTQVFEWPAGSKHIVQFPFSYDQTGNVLPYQSQNSDNIRYAFSGWAASNNSLTPAGSAIQTVTADPTLTSLIAQITVTYRLHISMPESFGQGDGTCAGAPTDASQTGISEGIVYVAGICYNASTTNLTDPFVSANSSVINAFPYPGWVFYAWLVNGTQTTSSNVTITGPTTITPEFSVAKRVSFLTAPIQGLNILVDGAVITTPPALSASSSGTCAPDWTRLPPGAPAGFTPLCIGEFDFLPGSTHTIGAATPQYDPAGNLWSFSGFSNGLGQNALYTAPSNTSVNDIITANFVPGVRVSITSNPGGMKLMIDGRDNWQAYNFVWGQGETHTLNAESPQTDSNGRVWQFASWSDKGAQAHSITVPQATDLAIAASYAELGQLTLSSSPSSLNFSIDGTNCVTPCVANKTTGSTSQITVPASIPAGPGARFDFTGWSDGNTSTTRTITYTQNTIALTANYQTSFQFTAISNPAKAGTFTFSPTSPDGFYASGTAVSVTAVANGGYKFAHWEGDITGTFATGYLTMSTSHTAQADFSTVPYIPPSGIQSVTGPTPDGSVAAGSLMSIYGTNLAAALQVGPTNPLAQTIGNITVQVGNYLLPLLFVSPGQIAAQVPWELAPGTYTLLVHNTGQPDVPGTFTVSRDAPGAFTQANAQNLPLVLALHQDGTVVDFSSPAVVGEQVTLYGTGFGPYTQPSIDGFPSGASSTLADPILINSGATQLQPDSSGPAQGMVGVSTVQLTITSGMAASTVNLIFTANGKPSSQVVLPVQ